MAGTGRDFPVWSPQSGLPRGTCQDVEILWVGVGWDHMLVLYQAREQICSPWPLIPVNGHRVDSHRFGMVWIWGRKSVSASVCLEFFSPTWTQLKWLITSLVSRKRFKTSKPSSTETNGFKIIQMIREEGGGGEVNGNTQISKGMSL